MAMLACDARCANLEAVSRAVLVWFLVADVDAWELLVVGGCRKILAAERFFFNAAERERQSRLASSTACRLTASACCPFRRIFEDIERTDEKNRWTPVVPYSRLLEKEGEKDMGEQPLGGPLPCPDVAHCPDPLTPVPWIGLTPGVQINPDFLEAAQKTGLVEPASLAALGCLSRMRAN